LFKGGAYNGPLLAMGAAMLGYEGTFSQALGAGMKAYQAETKSTNAAMAEAAQKKIENELNAMQKNTNRMQIMGQAALLPGQLKLLNARAAAALTKAASLGTMTPQGLELTKVRLKNAFPAEQLAIIEEMEKKFPNDGTPSIADEEFSNTGEDPSLYSPDYLMNYAQTPQTE
jgi:hypothetical protein